MPTAIEFNNISKLYRLGLVTSGTLVEDLKRWWTMNIKGGEDPFLTVGSVNDRSKAADSDYVWALKDIDFKVEQGDVVGIIGKNGAGKSTLLKILSKITAPTTGTIKAKGRIGSLLEVGTGFHGEMTGRENIFLNGAILGMTKPEIARKLDEIIDFSGCERYIDTPVKRYSSGMTVRLGFAVAAFLDPEILVVDEVLAVGDAEFQKKAIGKMQDVSRGEGRTVLFVSHNMDSMLQLCSKGVLMEYGKIKMQSTITNVVAEYQSDSLAGASFLRDNTYPEPDVYLSCLKYLGNSHQQKGMFDIDDTIRIELKINVKEGAVLDPNVVIGVTINTLNRTRVCTKEILLKDLGPEKTIRLEYPANVLMPNKYLFRVIIHLPNVMFYDRQDACTFTVYDTNSVFNKYHNADNGIILYAPNVTYV